MASVAPSEVALQNFQSPQLKRMRLPRWGLDVPLVQEEEEVQALLELSFFHHQLPIAADSSSRLDVGPMLGGLLVLEGIDHLWAKVECSSCRCAQSR